RVLHAEDVAGLWLNVQFLLDRPRLFGEFQRINQMVMIAMLHDAVDALARRPRFRPHALAASRGSISGLLQLILDLLRTTPDNVYEPPKALAAIFHIRHALAPDDDPAVEMVALNRQDHVSAFDIL